jgi:hypothetical protein
VRLDGLDDIQLVIDCLNLFGYLDALGMQVIQQPPLHVADGAEWIYDALDFAARLLDQG